MSPIRLNGSTSGYSQLDAPAIAGDQLFTLPGAGGTLDRINRAGNVLQVVNVNYTVEVGSSSTTFADTGLAASITPTSASNKVLVFVNQNGCRKDTTNTWMYLRLLRGVTNILDFERIAVYTNSVAVNAVGSCSLCYLDSPSTTAAVTYKTQFAAANGGIVNVQANDGGIGSASTITLMEIAA